MGARWAMWLGVVGCGAASPEVAEPPVADGTGQVTDLPPEAPPLPWSDDPCAALAGEPQPFADAVARFVAQDDAAPPPSFQVVVVGSSTIRRWETATRALAPWGVVQRGLGGARVRDVALAADELIARHRPSAVVVFAGTNDLAEGRAPTQVVDDVRCLVGRLRDRLGAVPIRFVAITPTPARWAGWADAVAVHEAVASWAADYPPLALVDTASAFLSTSPGPGQPPAAELFDGDGLHLSESGYALWTARVVEALDAAVPRRAPSMGGGLLPGRYVRVDLGPNDGVDGRAAPSPDAFGNRWNAWSPPGGLAGGAQVLAGEALRGLVATTGEATGVDLIVAGGFRANGFRNGGLVSPAGARLETLAVPDATGDFFFTETADDPGALTWTGLDPAARYTLRLFASRASADEVRVTRFVVYGGGEPRAAELTTTGPDIGAGGYDGNDGDLVVWTGLQPDAWGGLHLDVAQARGAFAYLSLAELEGELP